MSNTISVFRTEKKYLIPTYKKYTLLDRLSYIASYDSNSGYEGYQVRSLYFDSIFDNDLGDKTDGLENRKKIRLRIYSPNQERVKLEIKQKQGAAQLKKSTWIPRSIAKRMIRGDYSGLSDMGDPVALEIFSILEMGVYRPKCIIEYHRIAFMDKTNNIRITFDSKIEASRNVQSFFDNHISYAPVHDDVLEVKYDGFLLQHFKQVLDIANSTEISVSKYAMSRELLG